MTLFLERLFGIYIGKLFDEGRRFVELRALKAALETVKGARRIAIIYYLSVVATMINVAILVGLAMYAVRQFELLGGLRFDAVYGVGLAVFLLGQFTALWALREKRWLNAFGIQRRIDQAMQGQASQDISRAEIELMISQMLDQRLREIVDEMIIRQANAQAAASASNGSTEDNFTDNPERKRDRGDSEIPVGVA